MIDRDRKELLEFLEGVISGSLVSQGFKVDSVSGEKNVTRSGLSILREEEVQKVTVSAQTDVVYSTKPCFLCSCSLTLMICLCILYMPKHTQILKN